VNRKKQNRVVKEPKNVLLKNYILKMEERGEIGHCAAYAIPLGT